MDLGLGWGLGDKCIIYVLKSFENKTEVILSVTFCKIVLVSFAQNIVFYISP